MEKIQLRCTHCDLRSTNKTYQLAKLIALNRTKPYSDKLEEKEFTWMQHDTPAIHATA